MDFHSWVCRGLARPEQVTALGSRGPAALFFFPVFSRRCQPQTRGVVRAFLKLNKRGCDPRTEKNAGRAWRRRSWAWRPRTPSRCACSGGRSSSRVPTIRESRVFFLPTHQDSRKRDSRRFFSLSLIRNEFLSSFPLIYFPSKTSPETRIQARGRLARSRALHLLVDRGQGRRALAAEVVLHGHARRNHRRPGAPRLHRRHRRAAQVPRDARVPVCIFFLKNLTKTKKNVPKRREKKAPNNSAFSRSGAPAHYGSVNPLFWKPTPSNGKFMGQSCYGYLSFEAFIDGATGLNEGTVTMAELDAELPTMSTTAGATAQPRRPVYHSVRSQTGGTGQRASDDGECSIMIRTRASTLELSQVPHRILETYRSSRERNCESRPHSAGHPRGGPALARRRRQTLHAPLRRRHLRRARRHAAHSALETWLRPLS